MSGVQVLLLFAISALDVVVFLYLAYLVYRDGSK